MKLCLDACVALAIMLPEKDTDAALALREDVRNQIHELIAPDSLPIEVAHALTRAERQGKINAGMGRGLFDGFLEMCPPLYPYFDYLDRAMQLSSKFRIGVFDCVYIALCEEQGYPVVTVDKRFLELFPSLTLSLDSLWKAPEFNGQSSLRRKQRSVTSDVSSLKGMMTGCYVTP